MLTDETVGAWKEASVGKFRPRDELVVALAEALLEARERMRKVVDYAELSAPAYFEKWGTRGVDDFEMGFKGFLSPLLPEHAGEEA